MFWFSDCKACGILPPQPGMETTSPGLKGKVLISGLQGSPKKEDFDGSQHLTDIHVSYMILLYEGHSVFFHRMFVFLSVLSPGSLCCTFHSSTQKLRTSPGHLIDGLKNITFCLFFTEMTLSISLIHLIITLTWYDKITYI